MSNFVNLSNTSGRPDGQYNEVINSIKNDGVCPFCPDYLEKYHKNPILTSTENWLATRNMYPYKNTSQHLLFIHKKHIEDISEVEQKAWSELHEITEAVRKQLNIVGGTLLMRFGDTTRTGASVSHLHAQLISGLATDGIDPVLARVG